MAEQPTDNNQTLLYESTKIVFQGGGCRGAALVGAYEVALQRGVNVTEVAGTSAGSIMAALVGAGASIDQLKSMIAGIDFKRDFTSDPTDEDAWDLKSSLKIGLVKLLSGGTVRRLVKFGGLHSSEPISTWLDNRLAELLPGATRPIKFRDLPKPVTIVATDLQSSEPVVWSSQKSPDEIVSFAVRASCSIPGFYQPVKKGSTRLVDGGVVSNLPPFVFADRNEHSVSSFAENILAFCLKENYQQVDSWNPKEYLTRLINSAINSGISIQLGLSENVGRIDIPTGDIRATDFDKMNSESVSDLMQSGRQAASDFFRTEITNQRSLLAARPHINDSYEMYYAVVQESRNYSSRILIASKDTRWFWNMFPTALSWMERGSTVRIAVTKIPSTEDASKEAWRRAMIKKMGFLVTEVDQLDWQGFFFDRNDLRKSSFVLLNSDSNDYAPFASRYIGSSNTAMLSMGRNIFESYFSELSHTAAPGLVIKSADQNDFFRRLRKGVAEYNSPDVQFSVETIALSDVSLIAASLRAYKYIQMRNMIDLMQEQGINLFEPAKLEDRDGGFSLITPPVVEQHGDKLIAIEGNTRLYWANRQGLQHVTCIVVRNVRNPLPGYPVPLDRVVVESRYIRPEDRIKGFNYANFRSIESSIHQGG